MRPGSTPASRLITLIVIVMAAFAWLAPAASAQVPGVPDPGDLLGGGGASSGGSTNGGSGSGSGSGGGVVGGVVDTVTGGGSTSPGSGSGSGSSGIVDGVVDTVTGGGSDPIDTVKNTVKDTVHDADQASGGTVGDIKDSLSDTAGGAVEGSPIGNPLSGFGNGGKGGKATGPQADGGKNTHHSTSGAPNHSNTMATQAAFKTEQASRLDAKNATEPAQHAATASSTAAAPSSDTPLLTQLAQAATEAAEKLAFPLALGLMVVAFLMVQGRIDRKDAKLVLAPIDAEQELLSFQ